MISTDIVQNQPLEQPPQDQQHQHQPAAESKLAKSCEQCQKRKKRCDGGHPCERCARLGNRCSYLLERKRGPKLREHPEPRRRRNRRPRANAAAQQQVQVNDPMVTGESGGNSSSSSSSNEMVLPPSNGNGDYFSLPAPAPQQQQQAQHLFVPPPPFATPSASGSSVILSPVRSSVTPDVPLRQSSLDSLFGPPFSNASGNSLNVVTTTAAFGSNMTTAALGMAGSSGSDSSSGYFGHPHHQHQHQNQHQHQHHYPQQSPPFMTVNTVCPGYEEHFSTAVLGVDLDAVFGIFFRWFYVVLPVFTEDDIRAFMRQQQLPDHVLYSMCAIASAYKLSPRSKAQVDSLTMPHSEYFVGKAHETLMARLTGLIAPSIFEAYSLSVLSFLFTVRTLLAPAYMYMTMSMQVVRSLISPVGNQLLSPTPPTQHLSLMFWTLYTLDRKSVFIAPDKYALMAIDTYDTVPELPRIPTSPTSPVDASRLFTAFVRVVTLLSRITLWLRDGVRSRAAREERNALLGIPILSCPDTVLTLMADVSAFTADSSFPPPYLIDDIDMNVYGMAQLMSDFESHHWMSTNLMYRLCVLYFETNPQEKWRTIELVVRVAPQVPTPTMSYVLRIVCEMSNDLVKAGHLGEPSLSSSLPIPPPPSATAVKVKPSTKARWTTTFPTLEMVISWYEPVLTPELLTFWWYKEDYARIRATVNNWRQLLEQPLTGNAATTRPGRTIDSFFPTQSANSVLLPPEVRSGLLMAGMKARMHISHGYQNTQQQQQQQQQQPVSISFAANAKKRQLD
ncbi:hypothetical protein RI367_000179 [Sorochytrium milnesiophthora]